MHPAADGEAASGDRSGSGERKGATDSSLRRTHRVPPPSPHPPFPQTRRVAAFAAFARRAGATLGAHETALIEAAADERVAGAALGRASGELDDAVEEALEWVRDEVARASCEPDDVGGPRPASPALPSPSSALVAIERTRLKTLCSRARESVSSALECRAATAALRRAAAGARQAAGEQGGGLGARLGDVAPALEERGSAGGGEPSGRAPLRLEGGDAEASPLDLYDPAWRFRPREGRRERLREAKAEAAGLEAVAALLEGAAARLRLAERAAVETEEEEEEEEDGGETREGDGTEGSERLERRSAAAAPSPSSSPARRLEALSEAASSSLAASRAQRKALDAALETWWRVPALDAAPWVRRGGKTARQWAAEAERGPGGDKGGGRRAAGRRPFVDLANRA